MVRSRFRFTAAILGLALALRVIPAQGDSTAVPTTRSVISGVFNSEQVSRGRAGHRAQCASCHGAESYSGEAFEKAWKGQSVFDLMELIRTTMPNDNPGNLLLTEYVDIVAYILNLNGYPPGEAELPADVEALKLIRIDTIPPRS
jgi:mono/diheme cytochrome c family protein